MDKTILIVATIGIVAVAWYFILVKNQTSVVQPYPPAVQSPGVQPSASSWKTYRNEKFKFEFQYPGDWKITETTSAMMHSRIEIVLTHPDKNQVTIEFSIAPMTQWGHHEIECPVSIHVAECKNLENANGVKYAKEVSTGQLEYDAQQQLDAFFATSNSDIQMTALLTETEGKPLPFIAVTTLIFDKILDTLKVE